MICTHVKNINRFIATRVVVKITNGKHWNAFTNKMKSILNANKKNSCRLDCGRDSGVASEIKIPLKLLQLE